MTYWDKTKVLVSGASGFIGSHLTECLVKDGSCVKAFVLYNSRNDWGNLEYLPNEILDKIEIIPGDLTDPFSVEKAVEGVDMVFHLGSLIAIPYSYIAPWQFISTNVQGTVNILEASRKFSVRKIIHTSTSEVYGTAIYTPIDEGHPLQAQSPYSASKISADKMAESYYRSFDLPVSIVRPFNTFGPRQSARAVIPTIISQAITSKIIKIGSLEPVRDLTYVEDTVDGFLAVARSDQVIGEVVSIGNGKGISINDLVHLIMEIMGKEDTEIISENDRIRPEKSEVFELICQNRKARELCSWGPKCSLREGLQKTIVWIENNLDRIKPHIYNV